MKHGNFYRQVAFRHLENNISKRGVRKGNFRTLFIKSGSPEPVSLNKEAALAILHPETQDFPHVVRNVIQQTKVVKVVLPTAVTRKLDIKESYSEVENRVQVGNDQETAQSKRKSHSKNRGGEKLN